MTFWNNYRGDWMEMVETKAFVGPFCEAAPSLTSVNAL